MHITAVITAAGKGSRTGLRQNKLLVKAGEKTILEHTVQKFLDYEEINSIVITAAPGETEQIRNLFEGSKKPVTVTQGGATRTQSVFNGLKAVRSDCDIVLIHDGARPFVSQNIIRHCIEDVKKYGSAVTAVPVTDTIKKADSNFKIENTVDRQDLYAVQTPQGFIYKDIMAAYSKIAENESFTDDSSVYEKYFGAPYVCMGEISNIKITYLDDIKNFFKENGIMKSGIGYDSHRFAEGRKFILGGVTIPYEKGLYGHSDGDALVHAVIDSLFSAAGLPDIGAHFPDSDEKYKDADSIKLLENCREILEGKGIKVVNVSAAVICEKPRLAPYTDKMKENIAHALNISAQNIGISAKTNEGMGFEGRGEGLSVMAVCTITALTININNE
jgi:2-C-methyl-D-erythritol 4-phosphate cytidylyltransferase/2-C-methyl-D-erythritol 2,4-cyclodiphosphate synthase